MKVVSRMTSLDVESAEVSAVGGRSSTTVWRRLFGGKCAALATIFVATVVLWELAVTVFDVPAYMLPSPQSVVGAFQTYHSVLVDASVATIREVLLGFGLAVVGGVLLAVAMEYVPAVERYAYPLMVVSQAVPKVAVAPLFLVWFGFGELPKVLIAALIAFFPIVVSTSVGLKGIDPDMLSLAASMGAPERTVFLKIRLPSALPSIFAGLKLGITFAVIGAVVGEFVGGDHGLGYLVQVASGIQNMPLLFAALILLSGLGVVLFYIVEFFEVKFIAWHPSRELNVV